jgi:hypothetical protein
MGLRSFLTKDRSRERTTFAAIGAFFVAYGIWHVFYGSLSVAAFLAGSGVAMLLAAWLCSERTLAAIGAALILSNIVAGALALVAGKVQP